MRIERLTQQNLARCAGVLRQPFAVIGRLLPEYRDGRWSAQEELFPEPREKVYPDEVACARFLEEVACAGFAALEGEICAGLILLEAYWNRYAFVHELAVDREWRGRGVGTRLMDCAKAWAQERRLHGLMLETQDDNLLACRFYRKYGIAHRRRGRAALRRLWQPGEGRLLVPGAGLVPCAEPKEEGGGRHAV